MPVDCQSRRWLCRLIVAAAAAVAAEPALALDAPPRVIGFERAFASAGNDVATGQLLLGELNCTSCHLAEARHATSLVRKPAPVLDTVGSRVQPQYLLKFLADPQGTKPGTTMPNVLAGRSEAERGTIAEALVHFLAMTGEVQHANPVRQAVERGAALFHAVGCVACHDPRRDASPVALATSIPLGTPSRKYTLPGLVQFLQNPLAVRPGGRMPHLNLTAAEAREIASFLLNDLDIVSGLQYAYYEGDWEKLPDFSKLTPKALGDAEDFDLTLAKRADHFALRFEGTIKLDKEGDYLFLIGSDDGSRLLIDGKVVVANDGVHSYEQKRKKLKMTAGLHSVVVEYFEHSGEEVLQLDFEGPGETQQPLATLLTTPTSTKGTASPPQAFVVDPAKAAQGKEYFASLGCASCHTLKQNGSAVASTKEAPSLAALIAKPVKGGCLDEAPAKSPRYDLSSRQRAAIAAALADLRLPAKPLTADDVVTQHLVRFNCLACHQRDQLGGVEEARNVFFESDMPEMGDEGRLPPHLTGAGAKLTSAWLKTVFDKGAKDRPYMFTRMPKFGLTNVGELVTALETADARHVKSTPSVNIHAEDEKRYKAAGRRLVGAQGFSCIKCHTFAGKRSSGIQALSLTTLTERVRPEWFHHYLQNPAAYRPGTRMPTAFPDGQTTLPMVLDGTVNGQIAAIWNYLADGDKALQPVGLVTGKIELMAFDEAIVYRNFIEGAGPRAIGVGYPEKLNLAFDANELRIAMLWHGGFIDAAKHWTARGAGFEKPLGDNVLKLPPGAPLAVLDSAAAAWPIKPAKEMGFRFDGYRLGPKRQPTFQYSWNGLRIEDEPRPVGEQDLYSMQRTLTISGDRPAGTLWWRAIAAERIEELPNMAYKIDARWTLKVAARGKPLVRQQGEQWELLVPVEFQSDNARIELNYEW